MHRLLQDFAELVGREWARRWLEQNNRSGTEIKSPTQPQQETEQVARGETIHRTIEHTDRLHRRWDSQSPQERPIA